MPDVLITSSAEGFSVYSPEGQLTLMAKDLLRDETISAFLKGSVAASRAENQLITRNFAFKSRGKQFFLEARVNIIGAEDALIVIRDMTQEVLSKTKLSEMARQDVMTKLANRRCFEESLSKYTGKYCEKLTVIMLDIDGLKIINDTYGHPVGDQLIIAMSNILRDTFVDSECIARVGGDEFTILLVGKEQTEVELLFKEMNSKITEISRAASPITLSASFGYSFLQSGEADTRQMYLEADDNMYKNKLLKDSGSWNGLVKSLMKALETKNCLTPGRIQRLGKLAVRMGTELALPQSKLNRLELLLIFHDIGKVGIPDSILKKDGPLTANEWEIMKTHSIVGKSIAESSPELKDIAELILLHHERWDGCGYPNGLRGEEIPIECRLLSVVDAYDAMTNSRPYRSPLPSADAVKEIIACSGTQFEPRMVDIFTNILNCSLGVCN